MKIACSAMVIGVLAVPSLAVEPNWRLVATELLQRERPGFGGLSGIVVDHTTGDLWAWLSDRGVYHSADRGNTWAHVGATPPKGRTEAPGCWLLDPTGRSRTMVTALVYGSPVAVSLDRAATWTYLDARSNHVDWCSVDWSDPQRRFVLALKHESGGLLLASHDGGKSFSEIGKGFGPGWVFDNRTAVVATAKTKSAPRSRIVRTTDGGKTFQPAGDFSPVGKDSVQALPRWRDGVLYWLVADGLIATSDLGATWQRVSEIKDGRYGPIFGGTARHVFVLTKEGIVESSNGGATWSSSVTLPQGLKGVADLQWLEFDPKHDVLYVMAMGSDLWRWDRGK
jgi:hypothetical protein